MRAQARETLGAPLNNRRVISRNQTAPQIFNEMRRAEKNSRGQALAIANQFKGKSQIDTAKGVFNFLRHGMTYKKEPNTRQTVKEIRRYVSDGYGDCKHFATFAVGVLNACHIPTWFVLVSQRPHDKTPNHAYAQCMIGNRIITIDPCRPRFNSECIHYYKYMLSPRR